MWFGWLVFCVVGFWLGQRWADVRDLMMARRVARLVEQKRKLSEEKEQWEQVMEQDSSGLLRTGRRVLRIRRGGSD